jgi:hypothetical protein
VVYPNRNARIARLLKETEKELENGDVKSYDDIDKMFEDMGIKLDEV